MFNLDNEIKLFVDGAITILKKQLANVKYLLDASKNYGAERPGWVARYAGAQYFAVSSELLAFQVLQSLKNGYILISLLGLRTLMENYINVHFIFHHPNHFRDNEWADLICEDYKDRSNTKRAEKHKLGSLNLVERAKEVGLGEFYKKIYVNLCNYTHCLGQVIYDPDDKKYFKRKIVEVATYTTTFHQDTLMALVSFFENCSFENNINEISQFRKRGEDIIENCTNGECCPPISGH